VLAVSADNTEGDGLLVEAPPEPEPVPEPEEAEGGDERGSPSSSGLWWNDHACSASVHCCAAVLSSWLRCHQYLLGCGTHAVRCLLHQQAPSLRSSSSSRKWSRRSRRAARRPRARRERRWRRRRRAAARLLRHLPLSRPCSGNPQRAPSPAPSSHSSTTSQSHWPSCQRRCVSARLGRGAGSLLQCGSKIKGSCAVWRKQAVICAWCTICRLLDLHGRRCAGRGWSTCLGLTRLCGAAGAHAGAAGQQPGRRRLQEGAALAGSLAVLLA
jgi:hypothetical protein